MMYSCSTWKYAVILLGLLVLAGCGGDGASSDKTSTDSELQYNVLLGAVPSPNDLAFQGSDDGTVNAEVGVSASTGEPIDSQVSVNSLDGFSTLASATAKFTVPVDPSTVTPGSTVRVFRVGTNGDPNGSSNPGPKLVDSLGTELSPRADFTASVSSADKTGTTVAVTPTRPLQPDTTYVVVMTDGIQERGGGSIEPSEQFQLLKSTSALVDGSGNSTVDSLTDDQASKLESVRQLVDSQIRVTGVTRSDVIASWSYTTQTTGTALAQARSTINSQNPAFVDASGNPNQLTDTGIDTPSSGSSAGDIYAGVLSGVPYYLEPGSSEEKKVRTGFWTDSSGNQLTPGNRTPAANATLNIPVLAAIPKDGNANEVVIFQHGITANRTAMLRVANALTSQGLTVLAIDLPLHGVTDTSSGLYAGSAERTFNVDLVDNDGSSGPDGKIDPSGEHFINLSSLRTSRDNLRQGVADLFALTRAIRVAVTAGGSAPDLDGDNDDDLTNNISFLGHSLGGIVGVPYAAQETMLDAAVFANAGSGIAKLLDGSPTIGPEIEAGLEDKGLVKGLSGYEQFLGAAQTVIDSGDPANYAGPPGVTGTAADNHNTLLLEVVGGSSFPADQVVPNNVVKPYQQGVPDGTVQSPTAGSTPLGGLLNATQVASDFSSSPGDYVIRYTAGDHKSLLSPEASEKATSEMQTNVASFIASDGTSVNFIGSGTVDSP